MQLLMIKNSDIAKTVSETLHQSFQSIGDSLMLVQANCTEQEAKLYRKYVGDIFYILTFKLLEPIYREHPSLAPEGWTEEVVTPTKQTDDL
jgi:hypothetical protein